MFEETMKKNTVIGHPLPLHKFSDPENGKEPLENLRLALENRMTSKSQLNLFLLDKQTSFRGLLAGRERLMHSQAMELEAMKVKLKQAEDEGRREDEIIRKLQTEKEEVEAEKQATLTFHSTLETEVNELRHDIEKLQSAHREERNRLVADLDIERELENVKADRLRKHEEAKVKAQYKVKDAAIAAVRHLVNSEDLKKAPSSPGHAHQRSFR